MSKWDCWIHKEELIERVPDDSDTWEESQVKEGAEDLKKRILYSFKKALSYHRLKDPHCNFSLDCKDQVFESVFGAIISSQNKQGTWYNISVAAFEQILGKNWHVKKLNRKKEFCNVVDGTILVKLVRHRPIKEFVLERSSVRRSGFLWTFCIISVCQR